MTVPPIVSVRSTTRIGPRDLALLSAGELRQVHAQAAALLRLAPPDPAAPVAGVLLAATLVHECGVKADARRLIRDHGAVVAKAEDALRAFAAGCFGPARAGQRWAAEAWRHRYYNIMVRAAVRQYRQDRFGGSSGMVAALGEVLARCISNDVPGSLVGEVRALRRDAADAENKPVDVRRVARLLTDPEAVFNRAFPGYLGAGLCGLVLDSRD